MEGPPPGSCFAFAPQVISLAHSHTSACPFLPRVLPTHLGTPRQSVSAGLAWQPEDTWPREWWDSARVPSRVPSWIVRMNPDPSLIPGSGPGSSELRGAGLLACQEAWQVIKPGPPRPAALGHDAWKDSTPCLPAQGQLCSLTAPFCF